MQGGLVEQAFDAENFAGKLEVQNLAPAVAQSSFHLFEPPPAVRRVSTATIDYFLKEKAKEVKVEILDASGAAVRTIAGKSAAGHDRLSWDLRYPGATVFEGLVLRSAQAERGPLAPPGRYQVRVTADGQSQMRPLEVRMNPNLFPLFEKLINVVHQHAPSAKICFNTKASDTAEAIQRWVKPK